MKKSHILGIILLIFVLILIINFASYFIYFQSFHKNVRPITEAEKQEVMSIINQSMDIGDYEIKFGNVYSIRDRELVQIELIKGNSKKDYLVDLKDKRVIRK